MIVERVLFKQDGVMHLFQEVDVDRRRLNVNSSTGLDEMPKESFRGGLLKTRIFWVSRKLLVIRKAGS